MPPLTLHARYVFPVAGKPIPNASVTIDGRAILAVGPQAAEGEVRDLGNAAILPGLVNAHSHLDFSDLMAPLGEQGIGFVAWIRRAMQFRRTGNMVEQENSRELTAPGRCPITLGFNESLRYGVTTLGDIAQPGWPVEKNAGAPLHVTVFQELIAPTRDRIPAALELAKSHLHRFALFHPCAFSALQPGLSPTSPFSVHPDLLKSLIALSALQKIPLAMHLAESREEMELLRCGTGPLRTFLEEMGAWDPTAMQPGTRPLEYLNNLASAHRALVIHGSYLDDEELAFLGGKSDRMTVVYCPRTHDWFDRGDYPLQKMLAAGVAVALGTDGRGLSPDLSLLAEMRFAARRHPEVALDRILRMGTLDGAKALGREQLIGSLAPASRPT